MIRKSLLVITVLSLMAPVFGCVSLRTAERYQYQELSKRLPAVGLEPERTKDPTLAGVLNILPGIGNAYIGQWGLFACNLLFWPLSIAWGVPQAAIDAGTINKQDTVYYYSFGPGKVKLEELEREKNIQ